jgi:hypothetical protein
MSNDYEEVQNTRNRESELRAMRQNDIKQTPEKGVGESPLEKARLNFEDVYDGKDMSPEKNPMSKSPTKDRGFFGDIHNRWEPKPTCEEETRILKDVRKNVVSNLKTMKPIAAYILNITGRIALDTYNKTDSIKIATIVWYEKATGKTRSGLKRRRITGRGSPERTGSDSDSESDEEVSNGKKMYLNGGKFAVNMDKLRRNILHVYYVSSRASIP